MFTDFHNTNNGSRNVIPSNKRNNYGQSFEDFGSGRNIPGQKSKYDELRETCNYDEGSMYINVENG